MPQPLKVLIAEDNPADTELLLRELRRTGYEPDWKRVDTEEDFLKALNADLDLVLSDYSMPQFTGLRALELMKVHHPEIPFILVSGTIGEETAVEAMRLGATDYLLKDRLGRLGVAVGRALEEGRLKRERRLSEQALKDSEESLAQAQQIAHVGRWDLALSNLKDINANPLRWSDELFRIFGYEPGQMEVTNEFFFACVHPDDQARIQAAMAEALRTGGTYSLDHRIIRPDGTERMVHEQANVIRDADGRPCRLIGTAQDITERWRANEALRESESRLRVVTDNARVGLVMVNAEHRYTFANNTHAEILGLPSPSIVGLHVSEVLPSIYENQIRARLDQAFAGERGAYEMRRPSPAGMRHYAIGYEPTKVLGGVAQVVVVITEITERKQAEELVKASEARYHALFDHAPDGIVIADAQSHYIDANASICRMLGYTREELTRLHASDIVVAAETSYIQPALDVIHAHAPYHREWHFRRKDGSTFAAEVIAAKMPDGNLLGMIRDNTERRHADQRIREQLAELLRWQDVMMGRESRVQALKAEVNALLAQLKQPPRYSDSSSP